MLKILPFLKRNGLNIQMLDKLFKEKWQVMKTVRSLYNAILPEMYVKAEYWSFIAFACNIFVYVSWLWL